MFTKKNGVKGILHFLTAQKNEVENWLIRHSDPAINHAGNKEKHPIFGRGLKYKIKKFRHEETKRENYARNQNKSKGKKNDNAGDGGDKNRDAEAEMHQCFQDEELGSGY